MQLLCHIVCVLSFALVPVAALTQPLPGKPIRMVVGFPAGGPIDTVARILAPHFVEGLGQQVIVDNRAGELLNIAAKVKTVHVPYKGTAPAFSALLGGEVQVMVSSVVSGLQHVKAGRLRAVATTTKKRLALLPDVPTASETLPGFEVDNWYGLVAPAGASRSVVTRLHGEIVRIVNIPAIREKLVTQGIEPAGSTPQEFEAFWKSEITKWARVVKSANIRPE